MKGNKCISQNDKQVFQSCNSCNAYFTCCWQWNCSWNNWYIVSIQTFCLKLQYAAFLRGWDSCSMLYCEQQLSEPMWQHGVFHQCWHWKKTLLTLMACQGYEVCPNCNLYQTPVRGSSLPFVNRSANPASPVKQNLRNYWKLNLTFLEMVSSLANSDLC